MPMPSATSSMKRAIIVAAMCGITLAILWLTKGTGLLLTAGCGVWLVGREWLAMRKLQRHPDVKVGNAEEPPSSQRWLSFHRGWIAAVVFTSTWLIVASPLISRNMIRYGQPFYNVNSWLLFVDEFEDPVALAESQTTGEAAAAYLETHPWTSIV